MAKANGQGTTKDLSEVKKEQQQVKDLILKRKDTIAAALPGKMDADRFTRIVLVTISQNPKLLECTELSLMTAVMQSAQLGLEPGVLGQSYLIPYYNNKKKVREVQFQIGYKGLIDLARRSNAIITIDAHEVYEADRKPPGIFEFEYGFEPTLRHRPNIEAEESGPVVAFYAYAVLKEYGKAMVVWPRKRVEAHRDKYSPSFKDGYGPWTTEPIPMGCKTMIKQLLKYVPASVEELGRDLVDAIAVDDRAERKVGPGADEATDIDLDALAEAGFSAGENGEGQGTEQGPAA
jgi:recombination protein RecT|tara:strand:+ start:141 stop:1013 length:873 start_codon:yes stop_codon:yes gene_type:complete